MINNSYYTSSITSSTTRNQLLLNNYSNEAYPSSYCSCCCSFSLNNTKLLADIPLNPSFVFAPRQSSLIHWPPPSRFLLGLGGGGYRLHGSGYDLGRSCFVESCCVREDRMWGCRCCRSRKNVGVSGKKGGLYGVRGSGCDVGPSCFVECCIKEDRLRVGKSCRSEENVGVGNNKDGLYGFRGPGCDVGQSNLVESCCVREDRIWDKCCGSEKNVELSNKKGRGRGRIERSGYGSNVVGDVEAILSLLAEETVEVCLEGRENGRRVGEGVRVVEEHIVVSKEFDDGKNGRGDVGCLYSDNEVKKLGFGCGRVRSKEEGRNRREVERMPMGEDLRLRRNESSSSYCSLSDSGDFESDGEVEVQHEGFVEEGSTSYGKDSRKVGGVVISEETKKDSKGYSDKRDQLLQGGIIVDHSKVGSSTEWDCRKKSEKKLAVELAEETKSKKGSVLQQSHSSKVSSSKEHFKRDERASTSGVNSHWQSWSHIKTNDQESAYSKSSSRHQQVTQTNVDDAGTSSRRRSEVGEGVKIVGKTDQETGCEFCKSCGIIMQEKKSKTETLQHAEVSDSHDDGRWTMAGQGQFDNGLRKQEKISTSLQSSLRGTKQDQQATHVSAGTVGAGDRCAESTLRTRRRVETGMKNLEEQSTSLVSGHEVEGLREKSSSKIIMVNEARKTSQTGLSASQDHSSNTDIGTRSASQQRLYDERAFLASRLKSVEEAIAKQKQIEERMLQSARRTDVQGDVQPSGFAGSSSGEASGTHSIVTVVAETGVQQLSKVEGRSDIYFTNMQRGDQSSSRQQIDDEQASLISRLESVEEEVEKQTEVQGHVRQAGFAQSSSGEAIGTQPSVTVISQTAVQQVSQVEDKSDIHISVVGPSYQFIEGSQYGQSSTGVVRDDSDKITGKIGTGEYVLPQIEFASSSYDAHGSGGPSYGQSSPSGGTLGSVARMEETSNRIVGEFVEKMRHDASTSDTRMEMTSSQLASSNEDNSPLHERPTCSDDASTRLQKQGSRQSSGGSGTKGPSDEMWDVKDHFPQAPSEMEALEGGTSEDSGPRRTGKSLWSVVAGVFRWGSHSETQKSSVKTGGQSSSNESASGQTWFSGNEHDDSLRTEQSNMSEQSTSSDKLGLQRNATTGSDNGTKRVEEDVSSSSSVTLAGSLSSRVAVGASTGTNVVQQTPQSTPSLRRSDAFEEIEEAGQNKGVISSTKKQKEHVVSVRQSSGSSEASDVELKQRKLQRSRQFQQERFDEWEDAYRCENEQRRIDEIFMREALVEAKKASDSWEVAVGAVLVQNGKIVARGYNLVEELRDSTAHAEMICIRQGSSILKTWRLSETTLYVTLEPCPMCAGAILQARVGTVVWGAPNKLLGADGSWIRLFPEGPEGEQRPEVSDKPAPPVHPFHPKMKVRRGVLEAECVGIMQQFFQLRRKKEKEKKEKEAKDAAAHSSCLPVPHHPKFFHKMLGTSHFLFCL